MDNVEVIDDVFSRKDKVQKEALNAWRDNNYIGTIEAATGVGKTRIGVIAASKFAKEVFYDYKVLIISPTEIIRDDVWVNEFEKWKKKDVLIQCVTRECIQTVRDWKNTHWDLVIADEIHNYLSSENIKFFQNNKVDKLLGLSASISKERLPILKTIAPVCYRLTTSEAVEKKLVSPYTIYNIPITLTREEESKYIQYSNVIGNYQGFGGEFTSLPFHVKRSIRLRKDLLYGLSGKLDAVKIISDLFKDKTMIIFSESVKFAELVKLTLGDICKSYHSYNKKERENNLHRFGDKRTKITRISAVKALNEGVNVPKCSVGLIASGNSVIKDFIQRNGRVIRYDENGSAIIINLFGENTKEADWIKTRGKGEKMVWLKNINDLIQIYEGTTANIDS